MARKSPRSEKVVAKGAARQAENERRHEANVTDLAERRWLGTDSGVTSDKRPSKVKRLVDRAQLRAATEPPEGGDAA